MDTNVNGLKVSLCQMPVVPGRPDLNSKYIINQACEAVKRGVDIIVFPEMCVTGYLIGDIFEDDAFISDVLRCNEDIIKETPVGIISIFGTIFRGFGKGEDGRQRLHNGAIVASQGNMIGSVVKTLQPNYRFFNDDKHFYSTRKMAQEINSSLENKIDSFLVKTNSKTIKIGRASCRERV